MRFRCIVLCVLFVAGSAGIAAANGDATCPPSSAIVNIPADLPYTDATLDTCGLIDDLDTGCLGLYDGGEDGFYTLNVTAETCVELANDLTYGGVAIATACDFGSCVDSGGSSSGGSATATLSPGTYYVMHDTWPSPDCDAGTFTIVECAAPPVNDDCAGAESDPASFGITADGAWIGDTSASGTTNSIQLTDGTAACGYATSTHAADLVYYFDVANGNGDITLSVLVATYDVALWVVTDCADPDNSVVACSDGGNPETLALTGLADGRYYVVVDGYGSATGPFELSATGTSLPVELHRFNVE